MPFVVVLKKTDSILLLAHVIQSIVYSKCTWSEGQERSCVEWFELCNHCHYDHHHLHYHYHFIGWLLCMLAPEQVLLKYLILPVTLKEGFPDVFSPISLPQMKSELHFCMVL